MSSKGLHLSENENLLATQLLAEEFYRLGLRHVMLCPGSRSTPLTIAFARQPGLDCTLCHDERAAGFRALGIAKGSGQPAAVVCTSGTALANLLPAAVEACQDRVPLLLLSADRPPELRASGANQTIDQPPLLQSVTRFRQDMPCPGPELALPWWLSTIDECWRRSLGPDPGPAWLNLMFRAPLEPTPRPVATGRLAGLQQWLEAEEPWTGSQVKQEPQEQLQVEDTSIRLNGWQRPLLLAGEMSSEADRAALRLLARRTGWPVLCDMSSGLEGGAEGSFLLHGDWLLEEDPTTALRKADGVLRFGGRLLSKSLIRFFGESGHERIHVDHRPQRWDETHSMLQRVEAAPRVFIRQLLDRSEKELHVGPEWAAECAELLRQDQRCDALIGEELARHPGSEAAVSRTLAGSGQPALFAGNSLPIRHLQRVRPRGEHFPRVYSNRGASGIDGLLATAVGVARTLPVDQPFPLLIGDTSLLHDLNSLQLAARCGRSLRIVVLNNGGGAIFDRLPVREHAEFQDWFRAPLALDVLALAGAFGLPAIRLERAAQLKDWLLRDPGRASLAEFRVPFAESAEIEQRIGAELRRLCEDQR